MAILSIRSEKSDPCSSLNRLGVTAAPKRAVWSLEGKGREGKDTGADQQAPCSSSSAVAVGREMPGGTCRHSGWSGCLDELLWPKRNE